MKRPGTTKARAALLEGHLQNGALALDAFEQVAVRSGGFYRDNLWSKWEDERYPAPSPAESVFKWLHRVGQGESNKRGLIMVGPPRTGKSHLARLAGMYAIVAMGLRRPMYVNWPEFVANQKLAYSLNNGEAELQKAQLIDSDFLVIDDIAVEKSSLFTMELLYTAIESSETRCRPFIVTSNVRVSSWLSKVAANGTDVRGEDHDAVVLLAKRIAGRLSTGDTGLVIGQLDMERGL